MSEAKVLLFIVEGPSDEQSLAPAFEKIASNNNVSFKVMHYDITSDFASTEDNIEKRIKRLAVKRFLDDNPQLGVDDICGIVQVVDTDGVFAPDSLIEEDETIEKTIYEDNYIKCKNAALMVLTRENKRKILLHLASLREITIPFGIKVPYAIYYMSCNLDHVLHCKRNSTIEEKMVDSILFGDQYDDPIIFEEFFNNKFVKVEGDYDCTWDYIQKDRNSLKRGSNFWLCIDRYKC